MHKAISLTVTEFLHAWCLLDECHSYWNPVLKLQNVKCLILDTQFNIKARGLMWFSYFWLTNQRRKKLHLSSPQAGLLRPFILQMNYSKVVVLLCNFLFYVVNPVSISESPWQKNQKNHSAKSETQHFSKSIYATGTPHLHSWETQKRNMHHWKVCPKSPNFFTYVLLATHGAAVCIPKDSYLQIFLHVP